MDDFHLDGSPKKGKFLKQEWFENIKHLPAIEVFNHATMEMYHGGIYPTSDTFCGACWEFIKNEKPGERLIDWRLFKDDIEEIIEALHHYGASKTHPDYKFLQSKLTAAKAYEAATLLDDRSYSDLEITILGFTVNGNRLEIPKEYFIGNYNEVKEVFKNFDGKYSKNGFDFPYPAEQVLDRIRKQETMNLKKKFQFFGTPKSMAKILCEYAFDPYMNKALKVLEPEAGQGSIVDAVLDWFYDEAINVRLDSIHMIEFMEENFQILQEKYKPGNFRNEFDVPIKMKHMDFLKYDKRINYFDVVIANPPFTGGQDIQHFYKMYEVCAPTGIVVSIMSTGWLHNSQKKFKEFREWLGLSDRVWKDKVNLKMAAGGGSEYFGHRIAPTGGDEQVYIKTFEGGEFAESGTNVMTAMVVLKKNGLSGFDFVPTPKPVVFRPTPKPVPNIQQKLFTDDTI